MIPQGLGAFHQQGRQGRAVEGRSGHGAVLGRPPLVARIGPPGMRNPPLGQADIGAAVGNHLGIAGIRFPGGAIRDIDVDLGHVEGLVVLSEGDVVGRDVAAPVAVLVEIIPGLGPDGLHGGVVEHQAREEDRPLAAAGLTALAHPVGCAAIGRDRIEVDAELDELHEKFLFLGIREIQVQHEGGSSDGRVHLPAVVGHVQGLGRRAVAVQPPECSIHGAANWASTDASVGVPATGASFLSSE